MKGIYTTLLLLCLHYSAFAQVESLFSGRLLDEDSLGIEGINILNLSHTYGTVSNTNGEFTLPVFVGDTILFSAIQYQNIQLIVDDSLLNTKEWSQQLVFDQIVLNDIVLTDGFTMLDTTSKTFGEIDMGLPFNTVPVEKSLSERKESYLTSKLSSQILGALTGELKKLRAIQDLEKDIALSEDVKNRFDDDFYEKLGIPKDRIYLFVEYYMKEAKGRGLLKPDKHYDLIVFVQKKAEQFLENQILESDSIPISD